MKNRISAMGWFAGLMVVAIASEAAADPPKVLDDRLKFELFAEHPQIVTPTGIAVDGQGRVLVVESHTHFRPAGYDGPPHDRIRMFQDTDGDGRANRITTFFEGTKFTMNLAVCHDGSVYVATRSEIFRLRDTDNDGESDERTPIARLETAGDYPHNGLSGFAFDMFGQVYFGFGENLGADYRLIGTDGKELSGGGEGGSIFRCKLDGSGLARVATGFWNPFHLCLDAYGRLFAVDNDPDWRPPCRLLHIVEGGDYGYRYRLGRRGTHPLNSWFGEFPGTLGMVAGTGEAPSGIIAYESDNLPDEYRGDLLSTSWGFHAIERFHLERRGATFGSAAQTVVKGGEDFRPVGIALAPDGSLFISDWVNRSYNLHKQGRIWRLSAVNPPPLVRPTEPREGILSKHRPLRERAARELAAASDSRRDSLLKQATSAEDPKVRVAAMAGLVTRENFDAYPLLKMLTDPSADVREFAISHLPAKNLAPADLAKSAKTPAELAAALQRISPRDGAPLSSATTAAEQIGSALASDDVFVQVAAREALRRVVPIDDLLAEELPPNATERMNVAIVLLASRDPRAIERLPTLLQDADPRVRLVAAKFIGEERLVQFAEPLQKSLNSGVMTGRLFDATVAAIELINDKNSAGRLETDLDKLLLDLIAKPSTSPSVLVLALRRLSQSAAGQAVGGGLLTPEHLQPLLSHADPAVRIEAVRAWPQDKIDDTLVGLATDPNAAVSLRAEAAMRLSPANPSARAALLTLVDGNDPVLALEALRSLRGAEFSPVERKIMEKIAALRPQLAAGIARVLDPNWKAAGRPDPEKPETIDAWIARFLNGGGDAAGEKPGDAAAGERIFFQAQGAKCAACHRLDGRGGEIGPDMSDISTQPAARILESILNPSREISPRFVPWTIHTTDGRVLTGVMIDEKGTDQRYGDNQGRVFVVKHEEIEDRQPQRTSIMPAGLADQLTDQELRDLLAFLKQSRAMKP